MAMGTYYECDICGKTEKDCNAWWIRISMRAVDEEFFELYDGEFLLCSEACAHQLIKKNEKEREVIK
ncbi:hypothetical protein [Mechercharimyces sp. CAU 1602]|uniref:hypothetical protein n=1 Tax=Mechercharimyces sp. CAU 1602 TaxID=2973933 RepID=UPI0021616EBE|nr:hypothetical protein [Mechercharimyces sp. CAU 1602]MCS1351186.1 hypothetical protein [Mechercharimyces sp. CAU 1602]